MRYTLLGKTGLQVSELALGTMTFGDDWAGSSESPGRLLELFAEAGGNMVDTANEYRNGTAEAALGKLLTGRRREFVLTTKYTMQTRPGDVNSAGKRPVVALESSLITASPSVDAVLDIDKAVLGAGAVSATISTAGGRFLVGMEPEQIERVRATKGVPKVSARDIGAVLAGGGLGETTVAGTIVIAKRAGIEVFASTGIGGVHRRAQQTFDISRTCCSSPGPG